MAELVVATALAAEWVAAEAVNFVLLVVADQAEALPRLEAVVLLVGSKNSPAVMLDH